MFDIMAPLSESTTNAKSKNVNKSPDDNVTKLCVLQS